MESGNLAGRKKAGGKRGSKAKADGSFGGRGMVYFVV